MQMAEFDVFLSHNSKNKAAVRKLAEKLRERHIKVWLDEEQLVPGRPWQSALEDIIRTTGSAAVIVGPDGLGPWEEPESRALLSEFVRRRIPVIPVLMPGATHKPTLPLFLNEFTWVDLRDGLTETALDQLEWGVTGRRPQPKLEEQPTGITQGTCFVIMPFGGWFDQYYQSIYDPAIRNSGLEPRRADDLYRPSSIVRDIWSLTKAARIVLADLTERFLRTWVSPRHG